MKLESEHWLLLGGLLFILAGFVWQPFFHVGEIACIASYAVDLVKRVVEVEI